MPPHQLLLVQTLLPLVMIISSSLTEPRVTKGNEYNMWKYFFLPPSNQISNGCSQEGDQEMGVKGLSTPVIQDSVTVKNAYIKKLLEKDATNNINWNWHHVCLLSRQSWDRQTKYPLNIIILKHQLLPEVTDKVISSVNMYVSSGNKAVCVFDGITHKLKEDGAHVCCLDDFDQSFQDSSKDICYECSWFEPWRRAVTLVNN